MKIQSSEEASKTAVEFAVEILSCQIRKKEIDAEIAEIKANYKEEGCAVGTVNKIVNKLKARAKLSDGDIMEEDILTEKIEASTEVNDLIVLMNEKK